MGAETYVDSALALLRERGYRITRQRRQVLKALAAAAEPLSVYALRRRLAATGIAIEPTSLYRLLACFEQNGLAHRLCANGGYLRCTIESASPCHHHVVCERCGTTAEVAGLDIGGVERSVERRTRFRIRRHHMEFYGLCTACAARSER